MKLTGGMHWRPCSYVHNYFTSQISDSVSCVHLHIPFHGLSPLIIHAPAVLFHSMLSVWQHAQRGSYCARDRNAAHAALAGQLYDHSC
jgi:hypothetical protein